VSIKDAIAFRELQQQVAVLAAQMEQLVAEHATEKGRLTALEGHGGRVRQAGRTDLATRGAEGPPGSPSAHACD
jgi:hypothetical protein